jgi:hypothetical protein
VPVFHEKFAGNKREKKCNVLQLGKKPANT